VTSSNNLPEYLTRQEAAEYLRISLPTINRLIKSGKLKAVKVGGLTRILTESIRELMSVKN